ncbi:urease accessory protein UreD [Candidatus Kirkpatrickella diaphorinae]|uniref:Urease accessory protein UreD n=1 Tax=Candidatus Kirkpatrickella diaphorinae TaxID=2984322 RepID=A0ABY6GIT3_9PROT|nr:urease accessory protein UreD [Candidatus Kirkpatrickella diaphorinae]UYH51424.1 urease accessory protein UreD [Candidatus Kirkpatrickella diaphorinae]
MSVKNDGVRTRLDQLRQSGCLKTFFPHSPHPALVCIIVNVSGGIAASDCLESEFSCLDRTHLILSTQGAERYQRVRDGEAPSRVTTTCHVGAGAHLEWLPRETLYYDNAHVARNFDVHLSADARFTSVETRVFGRHYTGEHVHRLRLKERMRVYRDGAPLFIDAVISDAISDAVLDRAAIGDGAHVQQSILHVSDEAVHCLDAVRGAIHGLGHVHMAASAWNGLMMIRLLARQLDHALKAGEAALNVLRCGADMPPSWRY